jgi:hypothetical protein
MNQLNSNINLLTKEDFLEAIGLYEREKHSLPGSLYYDLEWNGKKYPPKSILALAYNIRFGELIPNKLFNQGPKSLEFKVIKDLGFKIVPKSLKLPFQISAYFFRTIGAPTDKQIVGQKDEIFSWTGSEFNKLNVGDFVFWIDSNQLTTFFTQIIDHSIDVTDEYGFKILDVVVFDESWNLGDSHNFISDSIENLLVVGTKIQDLKKKIERLVEIGSLFEENQDVTKILDQALQILHEKNNFLDQEPTLQDFKDYLIRFDSVEVDNYIELLRQCLKKLRISFGDKRVTYNYYNNGLYFTIGKRYSLVYKPNHNEAKFLIICTKSIGITNLDKTFGGEPLAYFCRRNDLDFTKEELDAIQMAMQIELSRTEKSTYQRFSKSNFEQFLFNKNNEKGNLGLVKDFKIDAENQGLIFSPFLIKRYIASLATKPFVIFTGLSGSGKTKLAQTFAKWICESDQQYKIIPVGADWTNREPLLGYPNGLDPTKYVLPDNGALDLILDAIEDARGKELKDCKPFFLILDEMNLSHVERYFADFLSGMESKEPISLYSGNHRGDENGRLISDQIILPPNLFFVGTVNIDETTYMFSPKVLDRANTIEFRIDKTDLINFFDSEVVADAQPIDTIGQTYTKDFMEFVSTKNDSSAYHKELLNFFKALQNVGAEFGYRTASEMERLIFLLDKLTLKSTEKALDVAVMQKLLPKLHGSRSKLNKTLPILASFCLISQDENIAKSLLDEFKKQASLNEENLKKIKLPLSFAKIARMYSSAQENGFASYAEG